MKRVFFSFIFSLICAFSLFAQKHITSIGHSNNVTQIENAKIKNASDVFFTSGDDGVLIKWTGEQQGEHYQTSTYPIKLISCSPNGNDVAIYETDGALNNIVTVWDWNKLKIKFQKKYSDTVTSLKFSTKGTYLIIGTSSIEGVEFINTSNWTQQQKLNSSTNIVSYIWTSPTEKNVAFYSKSGTFTTYNLQNGNQTSKLNYASDFTDYVLYNSSLFAGVKDNNIYVYNVSTKVNLLQKISSNSPILVSSTEDKILYYLETKDNKTYTLYSNTLSKDTPNTRSTVCSVFTLPKNANIITNAKKINNQIVVSTKDGNIYKALITDSQEKTEFICNSVNNFITIYDIKAAENEEGFYLLTNNGILKTDTTLTNATKIIDTNKETNFICYKDNIILWSNETVKNVNIVNLKTKTKTKLFTPEYDIQNIRLFNDGVKDYLLVLENSTFVRLYDFETNKIRQVYSGTGIHDAVLKNNGFIYVAKSASTFPYTPLLQVNTKTLETAPTKLQGTISYSLGVLKDGSIIGINFKNDVEDKNTYIFSYDVSKNEYKDILQFTAEDTDAFTYVNGDILYTNIGKQIIYAYNAKKNKKIEYKRGAFIPKIICQNQDDLLILNSNGSITLANAKKSKLLGDSYLNTNYEWVQINK